MIDQKAQELGRLLGQTEEFKALGRAEDRLKGDAECRALLEQVRALDEEIERGGREGREPTPDQLQRYEAAVRALQAHPVYQQWVAAQANFEKLMLKVNAQIADGVKKGSASPIITLG
ncbi:MAG TPA: YlbF family regulator [Gemmatimonadales bacterium]|nr:YlbF family regulator [Gemmatimonadales bacterium]